MRGDLADVALADRLFAPHYSRAVRYRCALGCKIRAAPHGDAEIRAELPAGAIFHLLDLSGGWAWGHGDADGSVGYVPAGSIEPA